MSILYDFTGYKTERHYFINDIGKKIALLVIGIETYGLKDDSFSSILDTYVKISALAKEDEKVEQKSFDYLKEVETGNHDMIQKFKEITDKCVNGQLKIFSNLNINFDVFTHESDYVYNKYLTDILDKLDKTGKLHEDEFGRKYVDLTGYNIPTREPVLVLTRSNGTSLYPIRDIAYTIHKIELNDKNNFIVLGEDQEVYMQQISAVLDILGYKAPKLICYSYVLLDGDKMSTSGGTVVLVTDFMKAVKETLLNEFKERNADISEEKLNILINACIKFTMLNVSKKKIGNIPLVHINVGFGKVAKGIIAIGYRSIGLISIGLISIGILSIGVLALGIIALGVMALGLLSGGSLSIGLISFGAISIGLLSVGAISVGEFSIGALSIGKYFAYGDNSQAMVALGATSAKGSEYYYCSGVQNDISGYDHDLVKSILNEKVPSILKFLCDFALLLTGI